MLPSLLLSFKNEIVKYFKPIFNFYYILKYMFYASNLLLIILNICIIIFEKKNK